MSKLMPTVADILNPPFKPSAVMLKHEDEEAGMPVGNVFFRDEKWQTAPVFKQGKDVWLDEGQAEKLAEYLKLPLELC